MNLLQALVDKHDEVPESVGELIEASIGEYADAARKLKLDEDGDATFSFGKHKGKKVRHVVASDNGYIRWFLKSDFPYSTRKVVQAALRGY